MSYTSPAPLITTWPSGPVESFASTIGFRYHNYNFLNYIVINPNFQVPQYCPCSHAAGHTRPGGLKVLLELSLINTKTPFIRLFTSVSYPTSAPRYEQDSVFTTEITSEHGSQPQTTTTSEMLCAFSALQITPLTLCSAQFLSPPST